jgi:hypothetical protein
MSLSDLASLGSFVSGLAVLVSLIFLYFQVRQAEKNQRGMIQTERASRNAANMRVLANPAVSEAYLKVRFRQSDLTAVQLYQFRFVTRASFISWEDYFFQHQQKLLDDDSFESAVAAMRAALSTTGWRAMWKRQRMSHEKHFRDFIDQLIEAVEVSKLPSLEEDLAAWHREVAAELATGPSPSQAPGESVQPAERIS